MRNDAAITPCHQRLGIGRFTAVFGLLVALGCVGAPACANTETLPVCANEVMQKRQVALPAAAKAPIERLVLNKLHRRIERIDPRAQLFLAPSWTVGIHKCRQPGTATDIQYLGVLPAGVARGFQAHVRVSKHLPSGGNELFVIVAKVGTSWRVLSSGTSP